MASENYFLGRRDFLRLGASAAALAVLGLESKAADEKLSFWDMPWGVPEYGQEVERLVGSYAPEAGVLPFGVQQVQWANFYQTFASAIASGTGPSVSTGGAYQAFQFAEQGKIHYSDSLVERLRQSGKLDDFLPGTVDALKTPNGYVGVPWQLDMRVAWYRKSLLQKAGVEPPTDWATWLDAGRALKKIGVYGFGIGAGAGNNLGNQTVLSLMLNNGGGLFDVSGAPDVTNERNLEAIEFVLELVSEGIVDPASVSYTGENLNAQWKDGVVALGYHTPSLDIRVGDDQADLEVLSPPLAPHGDRGAVIYVNNIMMYKDGNEPSSERFVEWYLNNIHSYWDKSLLTQIPVLKSVTQQTVFSQNRNRQKVVQEWQPVGKPQSARSESAFSGLAAIDGAPLFFQFTQRVLSGDTTAQAALQQLQSDIERVI